MKQWKYVESIAHLLLSMKANNFIFRPKIMGGEGCYKMAIFVKISFKLTVSTKLLLKYVVSLYCCANYEHTGFKIIWTILLSSKKKFCKTSFVIATIQ